MDRKFAQRAKEIVFRNGANKEAAMAELDALQREQMGYESSINTDRELENGINVEKEHKPTLDFIKKYHKENGKFPTLKKVAKSIAVDHIADMQKNPNNPGYETYYKGLIDNGLSDEVAEYMAVGGFIHPMNIPPVELDKMRMMAYGGPIKASSDSIKTNLIQPVDVATKGPSVNDLRNKFGDFGTPQQRIAIREAIKRENAKSDTIVSPRIGRTQRPVAEFSIGGPLEKGSVYSPSNANVYAGGMQSTPMKSSWERTSLYPKTPQLMKSNWVDSVSSGINENKSLIDRLKSIDANDAMRYAPVAFNAISGLLTNKSRPMDTSISSRTISPTIVSPEQISGAPIRDASASIYRGGVNSAIGASGGSSAALRSLLSGIARGSSRSTGEALSGLYEKNAILRGDASNRNAASIDAANRVNLDQANRADAIARENSIANAQDEAARSIARRTSLGAAATSIGEISKENRFNDVLSRIYGYDPKTGKKITFSRGGKLGRC